MGMELSEAMFASVVYCIYRPLPFQEIFLSSAISESVPKKLKFSADMKYFRVFQPF